MEEILSRIKSGIEFLKDGLPFKVGELYWGMDKESYFNISGISQYILLEKLTKEGSLKELDDIRKIFFAMVNVSPELKEFIIGKRIKFNLDFDYGMGNVRVCSEIDGTLKWELPSLE